MEGSGPSDDGGRELGGEGSARWGGLRSRKQRQGWTDIPVPETEGTGVLRDQGVDTEEVGRWQTLTNAEAEADLAVVNGTEVMEVTGWRNPRAARRQARAERAARAVNEASEGPRFRHFGDLLDGRVRETEASGPYSTILGLSSDEEDGAVTGRTLAREVIDLDGDSPLASNGEEAGPSQSSPLRRLMQRPASADAKRARRVGVEERDDDDDDDDDDEPRDVNEHQIPVALARPENVRRVARRDRSMMAAFAPRSRMEGRPFTGNGSRGRLGRHRLQPLGGGLSDLNNMRRSSFAPSSSENHSNGVVNLVEPDSPTLVSMRPENPIVLEDDGESERARQLAEDERVARALQDSFAREGLGVPRSPNDEYLARLLQAQENSHGRGLPIEQRPVFFAPSGMRALLGGDDDEREARRLFRNELAQGHVPDSAASSSRIVRRAYGRNNTRSVNSHFGTARDPMNARHFHFPSSMGLERRMDVLAALEMAFHDDVPVGLQLAHVDRDFNENDYEMLLALDTDNYRHRGASLESIGQLPMTTLAPTDVTDGDCSICLESPEAGDVVRRLPCMHMFHQPCIDQWLQCQAVCPVCKAHI